MTPYFEGGHVYAVDMKGQLLCMNAKTGERVWESLEPFNGKANSSATAFIIKNGDRHLLFTENGDLIIAHLSPKGYEEVSRTKIIEPTTTAFRRSVVWVHPAFADGQIFVRNDKEIVCVSLKK